MKKVKIFVQNLLLLFFIFLAIVSCNDEETGNTVKNMNEDEMEALFKVMVPSNNSTAGSGLRSIGESEENAVERVDVLAFRRDPSDSDKIVFDYYTEGYSITDKSFCARVQMKNYEQSFVVIANVSPSLIKEKFDATWAGTEKDVLLSYLKYSFPEDRQWTKNNYSKIPMSGISEWATVGITGKQVGGTIPLMRMVAKINVQIAEQQIAGLGEVFKLDCVYLYRGNTKGYIVPDVENIENGRAIRPSVPLDAEPKYSVMFSNDGEYPSVKDIAIRGLIYTFEMQNSLYFDNPQEAACLIVGGRYGKDNMADTTYFRADFFTGNQDGFRDILRNYQYDFNIVSVSSSGYRTPDLAYNSRQKNMTIDVVPWSTQTSGDIIFIGQSYLNVSQNLFMFSIMPYTENVENNVLYVKTNHPEGWRIDEDSIVDIETRQPATWLKLSTWGRPFPQSEQTTTILLYLEANNTGKVRSAEFSIHAGHLRYPVTVHQTLAEGISVNLFREKYEIGAALDTIHEHESIIFPAFNNKDVENHLYYNRNFHIRWQPKNHVLVRYMTPVDGVPIFRLHDSLEFTQLEQTDTDGLDFAYVSFYKEHTESLESLVTAENPFPEKQSYGIYIGTNGIETRGKTYLYRLIYYNCKVRDVKSSYPLNGSLQTISVWSNYPWRVMSIVDDNGILNDIEKLRTLSGGDRGVIRRDAFEFSLSSHEVAQKSGKEAKIIFGVEDGFNRARYRTDTVTIRATNIY